MNDDNKYLIIAGAVVICMIMAIFLANLRGCSSKRDDKVVVPKPKVATSTKVEKEEEEYRTRPSSFKSPSRSFSSYPPPPSDQDKERMAKKYEENKKKLKQLKIDWFEEQLKDPNISPLAREQYKFRSNPNFVVGMRAMDNQDYKTAIKSFSEITKDKKASAYSKYYACKALMDCAYKIKDMELYFIAARMSAKLIADEDLSLIGKEKGEFTLEWCDKVENTLKARNDPKYFDICVKRKLANFDTINDKTREMAKKSVESDIRFYTKKYKELIE